MAVLQEVDLHDDHVSMSVDTALKADGGVIVHRMLSDEALGELNRDLESVIDATEAGSRSSNTSTRQFWGSKTKRFTRLAWRSARFTSDVLCHRLLLTVADELLLTNCASYWMNTGQMMVVGPGSTPQYLHRDADNWPAMNRPTGFEVTVSCMLALSDFTPEAGATRVVPGSQAWSDYGRRAEPEEICQAVMPAGSGMIYTGRVLHAAGANLTDDVWRRGLHISYVLGWLTPEEAGPIGVPEAQARQLSPLAQRLLGWRCYEAGDDAARLWTVDYEDVPVGLGW